VDILFEGMLVFDIEVYVVKFVFIILDFELDIFLMWLFVNLIGCFEIGGLMGDVGFMGCKIIVDIYGGMVWYGGGVFSGKDFLKVDCLVVYVMCWVVKNVVVVGFVCWCEV